MLDDRPQSDSRTWLCLRMAEALHIDLGEAMVRGALTRDAYRDMAGNCAVCDTPLHCKSLFTIGRLYGPPDFCANRDAFVSLESGTTSKAGETAL